MQELVEEFEDTSCKFWWQVFFGWGKQQVYQIYRQKNRNHLISIMLQRIITGIIVLKNHSFPQNNWQMYITEHITYNHNLIWYLQYIYSLYELFCIFGQSYLPISLENTNANALFSAGFSTWFSMNLRQFMNTLPCSPYSALEYTITRSWHTLKV